MRKSPTTSGLHPQERLPSGTKVSKVMKLKREVAEEVKILTGNYLEGFGEGYSGIKELLKYASEVHPGRFGWITAIVTKLIESGIIGEGDVEIEDGGVKSDSSVMNKLSSGIRTITDCSRLRIIAKDIHILILIQNAIFSRLNESQSPYGVAQFTNSYSRSLNTLSLYPCTKIFFADKNSLPNRQLRDEWGNTDIENPSRSKGKVNLDPKSLYEIKSTLRDDQKPRKVKEGGIKEMRRTNRLRRQNALYKAIKDLTNKINSELEMIEGLGGDITIYKESLKKIQIRNWKYKKKYDELLKLANGIYHNQELRKLVDQVKKKARALTRSITATSQSYDRYLMENSSEKRSLDITTEIQFMTESVRKVSEDNRGEYSRLGVPKGAYKEYNTSLLLAVEKDSIRE